MVIGAGLLGLAAARALSGRGADVAVFDQATVGHEDGGSKGSCRIFRLGYTDATYVRLAMQARDLWAELEHQAGAPLLHPVPQLTFGSQMPAVRQAMRQAGAVCKTLAARDAAEQFPGLAAGPGQVLLEPGSCVIAADRVLAALAAALPAVRTGTRVTGLADDGHSVTVSISDAGGGTGRIEAGTVIVCAGPWTSGLLGAAGISVRSAATMEQVAYLEPAAGHGPGGGQQPGAGGPRSGMPIFIHHGGDFPYGLPVPGSARYKIGLHQSGPAVDPDRQQHVADSALTSRIALVAKRFLPGFDSRSAQIERCVYDNTPDEDFVVDRIGNVVVGCGTSGHGFKFGPLLGEWLATLAAGPGPRGGPEWLTTVPARFAVRRFG